MDRTINILGTEYKIIEDESLTEEGYDGKVSIFDATIRVRPYKYMLELGDPDNEKKACYRETLRHEVVHAMFRESSHEKYMNDEDLVQFIAAMFPKMSHIFGELGIQS